MLKLWNTASHTLEDFKPISDPVGMYTCGPTVYWDATIGNFRSFLFEDVLQRTLELEGFKVKRVMNITDVGHLTDDADSGEDKMEKAAVREGKTAWDIAKTYTAHFLQDAAKLNIKLPEPPYLCKATDHIPEQIDLIKVLEEKGFTYQTSDGVYFDTSKFPAYGSFSGQKLEEKEEGARVEANIEKRNKSDFALWKFSYPKTRANGSSFGNFFDPSRGKRRQMEWESPWGVGFPGWHIECSAMARKYLGQPFDIHCGGVDHIPVHHENEIAQSEAAYGVKLANYWLHNEFLLVDGQKMSKSLGNVYTVSDLEAKGFDPLALRFLFLGANYRQKQNFTLESLQAAQNALAKLRHLVRGWEVGGTADIEIQAEFKSALEDDLNTPKALAVMWKIIDSDVPTNIKSATLSWMDHVLGLGLDSIIGKPISIPDDIRLLASLRNDARSEKNWAESDRLRGEIEAKGWMIEDSKDGQRMFPKS